MPKETIKYGIIDSLQDLYGAVKNNPVSVSLIVLITYITSVIFLIIVGLLVSIPLIASIMTGSLDLSGLAILSVAALAIYFFSYALVMSYTLSGVANSLSPERPKLLLTVKKTFSSLLRTTIYFLSMWLVAHAPLFLLWLVLLVTSSIFSSALTDSNVLLFIVPPLIVASLWIYIALLRFAMVPFIAIFDPKIKLKQSFAKSKQLLANGGQWFVFKGTLITVALLIVITLLTTSDNGDPISEAALYIGALALLFIWFLAQGCLTMLYFEKSKSVK